MASAFVHSPIDIKPTISSLDIGLTISSVDVKKIASPVVVRQASSPADLAATVGIFKDYTEWLDEDITYQNYAEELNGLPGKYTSPTGALLLAFDGATNAVLGCIAMRPINLQPEYRKSRPAHLRYCEIKRLFVYPEARGRQVGRILLREAIERAESEGYDEMLLDSLSRMKAAINLYRSEGFVDIEPYNSSPLDGIMYFAMKMRSDTRQGH